MRTHVGRSHLEPEHLMGPGTLAVGGHLGDQADRPGLGTLSLKPSDLLKHRTM